MIQAHDKRLHGGVNSGEPPSRQLAPFGCRSSGGWLWRRCAGGGGGRGLTRCARLAGWRSSVARLPVWLVHCEQVVAADELVVLRELDLAVPCGLRRVEHDEDVVTVWMELDDLTRLAAFSHGKWVESEDLGQHAHGALVAVGDINSEEPILAGEQGRQRLDRMSLKRIQRRASMPPRVRPPKQILPEPEDTPAVNARGRTRIRHRCTSSALALNLVRCRALVRDPSTLPTSNTHAVCVT